MFKYSVVRSLGRGSYGRVDLATVKATGDLVAIKKVKLDTLSTAERAKAADEVRLFSSLVHQNIVGYKDSFRDQKSLYIVMEYVDGGDLEQRIVNREGRPLSETEILSTFVQILLALSYLHEKHILHRDLKPDNIFLTSLGIVKLGDFGVAKTLEHTTDFAKTLIGTPYYLAPELWESQPYNMPADIWSLGAVLYEMACLKKPFNGRTPTELLVAVMRKSRAPVPDDYSQDLRDLIDKMLSHEPSARPTAAAIKKLPFIRSAIEKSVTFNADQFDSIIESPKTKPRSKIPTRAGKRVLPPSLGPKKPITPIKGDSRGIPVWARPRESKKEIPTFGEEDAVTFGDPELFEDDFIDEDPIPRRESAPAPQTDRGYWELPSPDDRQRELLRSEVAMLERSMGRTSDDAPTTSEQANSLSLTSKAENLRLELEGELGIDIFAELYRNLQDPGEPKSREYIHSFERENRKAVQDVRYLIYLEDMRFSI
jgi:NIMA (never in mitosis gene a)-related kinase